MGVMWPHGPNGFVGSRLTGFPLQRACMPRRASGVEFRTVALPGRSQSEAATQIRGGTCQDSHDHRPVGTFLDLDDEKRPSKEAFIGASSTLQQGRPRTDHRYEACDRRRSVA